MHAISDMTVEMWNMRATARLEASKGSRATAALWMGSKPDGTRLIIKERQDRRPLLCLVEKVKEGWSQKVQVRPDQFGSKIEAEEFIIKLGEEYQKGSMTHQELHEVKKREDESLEGKVGGWC